MTSQTHKAIRIVWDYLQLGQPPEPADWLLVLESRDDGVARCAAELARSYHYNHIVITGGGAAHHNDLLATQWREPSEAEHFYSVIKATGLVQAAILGKRATNIDENARYSYELLLVYGIKPRSLLLVTKPYMERRALATFEAQ